jgi:Phytanoyl-CoA dioxygenase (PhyH)
MTEYNVRKMSSLTLTPEQLNLLPNEADVAFYETNGYYISKEGVLPESLIDAAFDGSQRFYQGERDAVLPFDTGFSNWKPGDGDGQRNNEFVSLQKKELLTVATYPLLGAIAAKLTRSTTIRLLDDQLIYKPSSAGNASSTVTGWHADRAYWGTCSSDNLTTAWIPLHSVEVTRSPLVVMAGSHLWKGTQDVRFFNHQNLTELEEKFRAEGKEVRIVPMTLKKGQVSFHHAWTIHGSYPNTSGQPRLSFAVHLQDGGNHYRPFRTPQGREIHIFDEKLCRKLPNGDPDFSDPSCFPTVWWNTCTSTQAIPAGAKCLGACHTIFTTFPNTRDSMARRTRRNHGPFGLVKTVGNFSSRTCCAGATAFSRGPASRKMCTM